MRDCISEVSSGQCRGCDLKLFMFCNMHVYMYLMSTWNLTDTAVAIESFITYLTTALSCDSNRTY